MRVAIYGVTGHTAGFVLSELRGRGHTAIAVGRDRSRVTAIVGSHGGDVDMRIASLDSAEALDRALSDVDAVVNCAGPFLDTATPLILAALRARIHYFDVTAEQASALAAFEKFDEPARARGIVVAPAIGFFGGLGDVLATSAMQGRTYADRIDLAIALDRWLPTRGTRKTGERNDAARLAVSGGKLDRLKPSAPKPWSFPQPFGLQDVVESPLTETILLARHLQVTEINNFINQTSLRDVSDPKTPEPVAADERGRSDQRFFIEAVVRNGAGERRVAVRGRDIYATTAPLVVEAVERVCRGSTGVAGAFALGQLVDASAFLHALAKRGELTLTGDGDTANSR